MTMTDEKSLWNLGSGLPLDGAEVTVAAAAFTFNNDYAANACVLELSFVDDQGTEAKQLYSLGKGWEPQADGERAGHESGTFKKINDNSNYGKWLKAFMAADGAMEYARGTGKEPDDASLWLGMRLKLKASKYTTQTGKESTTMVVDQFLGGSGAAVGGASPVARLGNGQVKASAPAVTPASDDMDDDLREGLLKLAAALDTHDEFMDAALELDGVAGVKANERAVMNKKPGSIWAQAKG